MEQLLQTIKAEYSGSNTTAAQISAQRLFEQMSKSNSQSELWQRIWLDKDVLFFCFLLREKLQVLNLSNSTEWDFWLQQYCLVVDSVDTAWCHANSDMLGEVTHKLCKRLIACGSAIRGLLPLMTALVKLLGNHEYNLTTLHGDLVELAIHAKCIKPILPILGRDVYDIDSQKGYFHMKHYLLYFYRGGDAYLAVKNYKRALWFFEQCMISKAKKLSKITVDAYKKYILVCLLVHGKVKPPISLANPMYQLIKDHPRMYLEFANLFSQYEPEKLIEFTRVNEENLRAEEMLGLAKQCIQHQRKLRIQQLGQTFVTISLTDLVSKVRLQSVQEAERLLLSMVNSGMIHAKINHSSNIVHFFDDMQDYSSVQSVDSLLTTVSGCSDLQKRLETARRAICLHRHYQKAVLNNQESMSKMYH